MADADLSKPPPVPPPRNHGRADASARAPNRPPATGEPRGALPAPKRRTIFGGVMHHLSQVGQDMLAVVLGHADEPPAASPPAPGNQANAYPAPESEKRLGVMHQVAEKLRGAADGYIAAKLDEIEARVDTKLDQIEHRIDHKIVELHRQIAEMRDRELRHRLRLLKITLIFTVLVALLSLGYKWVSKYWV